MQNRITKIMIKMKKMKKGDNIIISGMMETKMYANIVNIERMKLIVKIYKTNNPLMTLSIP